METKTKMKGNTTPSNSSGKEILNYYEYTFHIVYGQNS